MFQNRSHLNSVCTYDCPDLTLDAITKRNVFIIVTISHHAHGAKSLQIYFERNGFIGLFFFFFAMCKIELA